uniref:Uncharacterized protein n=1 Tax=Setaria italica TaxID=4555 RepID=K3YBE7_SETIT
MRLALFQPCPTAQLCQYQIFAAAPHGSPIIQHAGIIGTRVLSLFFPSVFLWISLRFMTRCLKYSSSLFLRS